jgi:hypothetical protein
MKRNIAMKKITRIRSVIVTLQTAVALTLILFAPGRAAAEPPPAVIEWQLSDTRVISWGTIGNGLEGSMRSGIRIEAKAATTTPGAIFSEGKFSTTLNAFKPIEDMGDQKAGTWYLRGQWSVTAQGADPAILKARYNPYSISGQLTAAVPYDPASATGVMEAEVRLQRAGIKPRTGRMPAGVFVGTTNFEGTLTTPFISTAIVKRE